MLKPSPMETDSMNKILTLALILGAVIAFGSVPAADADSTPIRTSTATADIHVLLQGDTARVSIRSYVGSPYAVFDATGLVVAEGILDLGRIKMIVPLAGTGPNGVVLTITVNDDVVTVTDPDWEWN